MTRTLVGADEPENPHQARLREAIHIATTGQIPEQPERLTRRKRHLVVAADHWDNLAAVWFIRSGHSGQPEDEIIRLEHDGTDWKSDGSSGGAPGADITTRISLDQLAHHFSRQYHHTKAEEIPFGFRAGSSAGPGRAAVRFQTVNEVSKLTFNDREPRSVADHGYCLVLYDPKQPPTITAFDTSGNNLGSFTPKQNPHRQHLRRNHILHRLRRPHHRATLNRRRRWRRH